MKGKNRIFSIVWVVLGLALIAASTAALIDNFGAGFGGGLAVIGILQLVRQFRYQNDREYQEKVDVECNDERNVYIRNKAWASAAYVFVILAAAMVVLLKVVGKETLMMGVSFSLGMLILLFWGFYFYWKAKI